MSNNYGRDIKRLFEIESGLASDNESLEVIAKYNGNIHRLETELGAQVEVLGAGYAIITLQGSQIPMLYNYREIQYIELPKTLSLTLNQSLRTSCISPVHRPEGYNLTGDGVLVGVIDSGIDYTHPDFRNRDGTSRILYIWDQTENGNPPYGFKQGAEYDNRQLNMALNSAQPFEIVSSTDEIGHGTAVAGIAAGNGSASGNRETGAAPKASLIIVKMGYRGFESFARTTEIMRALKYIIDKAETLGMPVAVNISFGTNDGSHDGSSLFETYIDAIAMQWKTVIVAASGNEGAAGHHFSGKANPMQTMDVDFIISESLNSLYLSLWKNFVDDMTFELILPSGNSTGVIDPSQRFTVENIDGALLQIYYGQPTHYSENQEIYFSARGQGISVPQGIWRLRVRSIEVTDGRFNIWMPTTEEVGRDAAFTGPSAETTLTLPSTARNAISVGGYNSATGASAQFSGRGFARNNAYVKPDLVAPAMGIISARPGGGYDSYSGTSMAAPFVTGAAALMMQWGIVSGNDPFLFGQRIKAFLKKGAERNPALSYPNPIWGYGTLCLKTSMDLMNI